MKKASSSLKLDHAHPRKDGSIPVVVRVYSPAHKRNRDYATGQIVHPDDVEDPEFTTSSLGHLNRSRRVIDRLYANEIPFDWEVFEKQFLNRSTAATVNQLLRDKIADLTARNKSTTTHKDLLRWLESFRGENIPLTSLNQSFIKKFTSHLSPTNNQNSINIYLRTLRARINDAKRDGLLHRDFENPIISNSVRPSTAFKRHLTREELALLVEWDGKIHRSRSRESQYMFHLSYLCRGMNPVDMFSLEWPHVGAGYISYHRTKTGDMFKIKITPKIQDILNYFREKYPGSKYILPVLHEGMDMKKKNIERITKNRCRVIANNMRKIAKIVGVPHENEINAYTARHTFAAHYLLYDKQPSIYRLMKFLGHSSEQATRFYIASLRIDLSDELDWM